MSHKGNRGGAINLRRVFTGIVEELGRVESRRGSRLRIGARTVLEEIDLQLLPGERLAHRPSSPPSTQSLRARPDTSWCTGPS